MKIRNFIFFITIVFIQAAANGCSRAGTAVKQMGDSPAGILLAEETSLIQIEPVALDLPVGHRFGRIAMGVLCIPMTDLKSLGGKAQVSESDFTSVVIKVLENANYGVTENPLPGREGHNHDDGLVLIGIVKDLKMNGCFPKSGFRSWKISKGESRVKIHWQLYAEQSDKILFEKITAGSDRLSEALPYGFKQAILGSVAAATENLIADKQFNTVLRNSIK